MDPRLHIPSTELQMRVAPALALSCMSMLEQTPIVIAYGGPAPSVVFDADVLSRALGAAWPAVDRALSEISPAGAHAALRALVAEDDLIAEAVAPLAEAEARLIEGEDRAATAVIVLVLVQARIAAIVDGA